MQNAAICIIIYYHEHNDDYIVFLTYFINIDDTLETARDENNDGNMHSIISISHDPGKSFLISMAYQSCTSYTKYVHSTVSKDSCDVMCI